jgi:hypothetical protein
VTDGFDEAIRNAAITLLQADASLTVITGPVPAGQQPPYVRIYTNVEWLSDDPNNALDGLTGRATARWTCHCIGANDLAAIRVAERVRTDLLDQRPTLVAGLVPGLIRYEQDAGTQPSVDELTGTAVVDAIHVYRLTVDT